MPSDSVPQVYLIGGPNGAGKTTSALALLENELLGVAFVNADLIAVQLNPATPEAMAFQAGRLMLKRIEQLSAARTSFAFESTLATKGFAPFLRQCQEHGYFGTLLYFWLNSPELAVERVQRRVSLGGHHVPETDVRRRYERGLINLHSLYIPIADYWTVLDNSSGKARSIAEQYQGTSVIIYDEDTWQTIRTGHESTNPNE
ncbi:zeta toxin family protein [Candidatus Cyanaurora vandensis]|uniref:zeta toxin family protein n=1 Tax=Candidatus Cyanaurora vandensis TaxID=2714958 RepID=UPI00257DA90F|nr:zeta toxin family protein [Candidatus Cyanaurora vandensis]